MTSAGAGGFAGAKAALGAVGQQTQWMSQQVSAGKLALDPEAAEAAAKHCEDEIEAIQDLVRQTRQLGHVDGLGDYSSGKELARRFVDKGTYGGSGAQDLLGEMQKQLQQQADAFRAAAKDYRATDDQISDDMQRGMKQ